MWEEVNISKPWCGGSPFGKFNGEIGLVNFSLVKKCADCGQLGFAYKLGFDYNHNSFKAIHNNQLGNRALKLPQW